ncbi:MULTISPECIES: FKBP-type peptidyl-prolyl cis-trans isomerase [Oceanimonas]|uniref:Peptidyl-prolyl cis-trans isomerase n=1 Tax=Oceanimonas doudoroffii TaxID=84158 RepID=A0A233RDW7_9GAMM|nr:MULTISPECIES: peptidylprolyl isomerase [Oceanimonas]NHH99141.1 FKBP-type peptidyl-prolyl cis-trans isomerase SlyD [Oceanimonas sp. MB9]OXY81584.1 peptidylprolyl isomerase [Oceanimonas doudoroffii]
MQIANDTVVQFNYTLKDEQGEVMDTNEGKAPLAYLHGHNNMLEGLEKALDGKSEGDSFSVTLAPADAYGERDESLIQRISVRHLQGAKRWEPGMVAMVHTENGPRQVVVVKVGRFMADVDLNHLLAGRTLTFDLDVVSVRAATEEELEHGHAHGEGGHQH